MKYINRQTVRNTHPIAVFLVTGAVLLAFLVAPTKAFAKTYTITIDDDGKINFTTPSESTTSSQSTTPTYTAAPTRTMASAKGGYVIPDSASRYLSASELSKYSDWQLYIARNEIYARHGRGFKKANLRNYFNNCCWYTYRYDADYFDAYLSDTLSDIEQTNAVTILDVENARNSPYTYGSEYLQP